MSCSLPNKSSRPPLQERNDTRRASESSHWDQDLIGAGRWGIASPWYPALPDRVLQHGRFVRIADGRRPGRALQDGRVTNHPGQTTWVWAVRDDCEAGQAGTMMAHNQAPAHRRALQSSSIRLSWCRQSPEDCSPWHFLRPKPHKKIKNRELQR